MIQKKLVISCPNSSTHVWWCSSLSSGPWPRNPRFKDAHTGTKRRLEVIMSNRESVISGTGGAWNRAIFGRYYDRTSTGESSLSMCDDACCDFSGQEIQGRYRTSTGESSRSMRDDACCDFLAKRIQLPISHIDWRIESVDVSRRQLVPLFFEQSPFGTNRQKCQPGLVVDTFGDLSQMEIVQKGGLVADGWSMCDDACCDFYGQENTKPDIAHLQANRVARCAMMHVVIFLAKSIQNQISHIDWRIKSVDARWCMLWFFWPIQ